MKKIVLSIIGSMLISIVYSQTHKITADSLIKWNFYGVGVAKIDHQQVFLKEHENSVGVTMVSPKKFSGNVVMRYKLMPLTAATVCVAMLNIHNQDNFDLTIPNYYSGYVQFWLMESSGYFFAFHNMAHNQQPFVRRCDVINGTNKKLQEGKENAMIENRYYEVEVGKKGKRIWLKIDNNIVLDIEDEGKTFEKGYLALRIRGTADDLASCLIKDLEIIEN
jgi:hypothetical protein